MNKLMSTLHDATHRVPGVPDHRESQAATRQSNPGPRNKYPRLQSTERHHHAPERHQAPPRVLIAWQNWIAERVGANSHR